MDKQENKSTKSGAQKVIEVAKAVAEVAKAGAAIVAFLGAAILLAERQPCNKA